MKIFRELYFIGNVKQFNLFINNIGQYASGDWKRENGSERMQDYLVFEYVGTQCDKARVFIHLGDEINNGELRVGNIVPLEKSTLSVDQYNNVLLRFYNDVIKPYQESGTELNIPQVSDDNFDPKSVISEEALKKLEVFCATANKSTGSSHPCDKQRWLDFICQTVEDNKMIDYSTLASFLQDESYWGKKDDNFIGVMGSYAWDREQAYELASEYENVCEALLYYRKRRGE